MYDANTINISKSIFFSDKLKFDNLRSQLFDSRVTKKGPAFTHLLYESLCKIEIKIINICVTLNINHELPLFIEFQTKILRHLINNKSNC